MPWSSIANALEWQTPSSQWTTTLDLTSTGISSTDQVLITGYMQDLYETSEIAQIIFDRLLDPAVTTTNHILKIGALETENARADQVNDVVGFDLTRIGYLYMFNTAGELVQMQAGLVIMHEIIHVIQNSGDLAYATPTDAQLNGATFDHLGPTADLTNDIAAELGWTEQMRASYLGVVHSNFPGGRYSQLTTGISYSDGNTVDIVRLGDQGEAVADNDIDHSSRSDGLVRDLIFGFAGNDEINAGAGDDFVYGGADQDIIAGGDGNDVIYGDDRDLSGSGDDDTLSGGDGDDFIDAGAGQNLIDGGDGFDVASFWSSSSGVTISWTGASFGHGSQNTLNSIETLIASSGDDAITVSQLNAVVAGVGGDDDFYFEWSDDSGFEDAVTFLQLGDGADTLRFGALQEFDVVAFDIDGDDRILSDGRDLSTLNFTYHAVSSAGESWYNTIGDDQYDPVDEHLYVGTLPGTDVMLITYTRYDMSNILAPELLNSVYLFVGDFESGDFGIESQFSSSSGNWQDELIAFASSEDYMLDPANENVLGGLGNDHAWSIFGVG